MPRPPRTCCLAAIIAMSALAILALGVTASGFEQDRSTPRVRHVDVPLLADDVATTHIIVRVRPDVEPVQLDDKRWSFAPRAAEQPNPHRAGNRALRPQRATRDSPATRATAELLQRENVSRIRRSIAQPLDAELASQLGLDRYHTIEVPAGTDTRALADALRKRGEFFEIVELDGVGGVAAFTPNDPDFNVQYGLYNTGQSVQGTSGVPGADINILPAWNIATGSENLIIAVLDSGLHAHVDLVGRSVPGYNVFTGDSSTPDGCSSHGTHVSGIIAANVDNSTGIAGVTWQSKIMPVRVVNPCSSTESDVAAGVIWATDNGADIINMSLQYTVGTSLFHDAIQYAYNSGVVLIAAAGNNGVSGGIAYPGRWPETIAVAATTNQDTRWSGSNTGPELNVAAPGHNIRSLNSTGNYGYKSGTSFAAPHVTGTAALMLSLDPALTHNQIRSVLETTAVDLGTPGFNNSFGHGRIDAHAALLELVGQKSPDLNDDGVVNGFDLVILLSQWGACPALPEECPADLNFDGMVDGFDLVTLLSEWG